MEGVVLGDVGSRVRALKLRVSERIPRRVASLFGIMASILA